MSDEKATDHINKLPTDTEWDEHLLRIEPIKPPTNWPDAIRGIAFSAGFYGTIAWVAYLLIAR